MVKKRMGLVLIFGVLIAATTFAQSSEVIGKVVQKGTTFTTYGTNGKEITHFSYANRQLVGWGKDFFVLVSGTTYTTYDARCKEISHISIGGSTPGGVQQDSFTVNVSLRVQQYDKFCKRK
jgi:hypothetical protein